MNLPSALVYSTRLRVSVYGTGDIIVICLADFLGSLITCAISLVRRLLSTIKLQLEEWICLLFSTPTLFNVHFRQDAAVSHLRLHIAYNISKGILTLSAIDLSLRMSLRTRLTQGRLTLPWKP